MYLSTLSGGVPGPGPGRGGSQVSDFGGVPGLRFSGGVPGLRFFGRSQVSDFRGGSQVSDFWEGGYPVSVKGKFFDTRFGLIHVQTGKIFLSRDPPQ